MTTLTPAGPRRRLVLPLVLGGALAAPLALGAVQGHQQVAAVPPPTLAPMARLSEPAPATTRARSQASARTAAAARSGRMPADADLLWSVVRIQASEDGDDMEPLRWSIGSGVVLADGKHVLTAKHVVWDPQAGRPHASLIVELPADGRPWGNKHESAPAELVALSEELDLALLELRRPLRQAVGVHVSDIAWPAFSSPVVLAGFPTAGGGTLTVTHGHVAGYLESGTRLKLDALSGPGSSGGPVFDVQGQLLGIVQRVTRREGEDVPFLTVAVTAAEINNFLDGEGRDDPDDRDERSPRDDADDFEGDGDTADGADGWFELEPIEGGGDDSEFRQDEGGASDGVESDDDAHGAADDELR